MVGYYRERGYVKAQVGQPELKILEDSKDGKTRFIELQIPVTEGQRYKIGEVTFSGNTVVKSEGLRPLFKLNKGDCYNEKFDPQGIRKGQGAVRQRRLLGVHRAIPDLAFPQRPARRTATADGDGNGTAPVRPPPPAA